MSLKIAEEHLKSQGRGPDTELIHMTKGEIRGLRQLAQAHGGDLTVNPTTGLPEAGFLSSALPMVLGAAAAATGQEWAVPLAMAMSAGGEYAMTGSLTQGLMAGISAWGGGNLASGIEGLGADSLVQAGGDTGEAAFNASQTAAMDAAQGPVGPSELTNIAQSQVANTAGLTAEQSAALNANAAFNPAGTAQSAGMLGANAQAAANPLSTMQAGLTSGNLGSYAMAHPGQVGAVALPLLGSALTRAPSLQGGPAATSNTSGYGQPLQRISPDFKGTFPTPPNPAYQAKYPNYVQNPYNPYATTAPTTNMAGGGLLDPNSEPVDFMAGGMYPQSQQSTSAYATPTQMPTSAQQTAASYEPKTNPLTGELTANMAGGGAIAFKTGDLVSKYDPQSYMGANNPYDPQSYMKHVEAPTASAADMSVVQDTDPETRNLDALSAALTHQAKISAAAKMPSTGIKSALPKAKTLGSDVASDSYMAQLAQLQKQQAAQQTPIQLPDVEAASGGIMQGYATGGRTTLGSYSDGGHLLKGPGDGMSDSIPAQIGAKQPARLADGEFVVPADVVSHLGNGSTEAGAKHLYAMMDKIRKARTGRKKQAPQVNATKFIPK